MSDLPWSETIRLNEIGNCLERRLEADAATRGRVMKALDLQGLDALSAEVSLKPSGRGWMLSGRVRAEAVQTCGLTLEPLPVTIDAPFEIGLVEAVEHPRGPAEEIDISLEEDTPDEVEGVVDLAAYALEQLALSLDPFPRKPGAEFAQPDGPRESSPFDVLNRLKPKDAGGGT
ncbi:YceD family protein [Brevundimonas lutea]|uniref:YceD family protein n=1 Tax=Brevundimonas lutea TaxID=2293980 RepID=UPI001F0BE249|nr:DUF177 domain-containing protein [Brevundimonas lutea]